MRHGVPRPKTPKIPAYRRPVPREETAPAAPPLRVIVPSLSKPRSRPDRPTSVPLNPRAVETVPCRYIIRLTVETHGEYGWALPDGTRVEDGGRPGDVFYLRQHEPSEACYCGWTNCEGIHLHAVCPGGHWWNIDSRAGNCTLKDDTTHRCWIRVGDPSKGELTVGKNGKTCGAGAGSIHVHGYENSPGYHGLLRNFAFTKC